jgi:hypothetical protein
VTEININTSQRAYFDIYGGTASDVEAVLRQDGVSDVSLSVTQEMANVPVGADSRWSAYIPLDYTGSEQEFSIVWTADVALETVEKIEIFEVVTPYITPEEVASRNGWTLGVDRTRDEVLIAERVARFVIDTYTGTTFGKRAGSVEAYGTDTDLLYVGVPMVSIDSLYEDGVLMIDSTTNRFGYDIELVPQLRSVRLSEPGVNIGESYKPRVIWPTGRFTNGSVYKLVGVIGWKTVPSRVKEAAAMLIQDYLCPDASYRAKFITAVTQQNWKIAYSPQAFIGTGNVVADQILSDFIVPSMMVI